MNAKLKLYFLGLFVFAVCDLTCLVNHICTEERTDAYTFSYKRLFM